jgi:type 1 fimbriae regulatory protein FimB/type 1 fimbriae regulatory protein FimE
VHHKTGAVDRTVMPHAGRPVCSVLRHACGYKLANDGHDTRAIQAYLGHRSIMSTVRYTALTPNRFKNFWKD